MKCSASSISPRFVGFVAFGYLVRKKLRYQLTR